MLFFQWNNWPRLTGYWLSSFPGNTCLGRDVLKNEAEQYYNAELGRNSPHSCLPPNSIDKQSDLFTSVYLRVFI